MAQVTIDTVAYPEWWDSATTVEVFQRSDQYTQSYMDNQPDVYARSDVELLPQGVSVGGTANILFPWQMIAYIKKAS